MDSQSPSSVFWWFCAPDVPPNLGITTLPGEAAEHYEPVRHAFEPGSDRALFCSGETIEDSEPLSEWWTLQPVRDEAFRALPTESRHRVGESAVHAGHE
jgi:hypothetical protein